jgi:hypothetical protein
VGATNSQEDLEQAKIAYKKQTSKDWPFGEEPWSPQMKSTRLQMLAKVASTEQQRLTEAKTKEALARAASVRDMEATKKAYLQSRIDYNNRREVQDAKSGLKGPTKDDREDVKKRLVNDYPGLEGAPLTLSVLEISRDAKALQAAEGGEYIDNVLRVIEKKKAQFGNEPTSWYGTGGKPTFAPKTEPANLGPRKGVAATPQGIPPQSKVIGRTPEGKPVWEAPNGKRYVE